MAQPLSKKANASTSKIKINISASELAPICGIDHFSNWAKVIGKIWKQYDLADYRVWESRAKLGGKTLAADRPTTQMKTLSNTAAASGRQEAASMIKSVQTKVFELNQNRGKCSSTLISQQEELKSQIASNDLLTSDEKKQLVDLMKTATNTFHGITNEVNGYKIFEECMGKSCVEQQQTLKHVVFSDDNYEWLLTGRIDGLTADGEVVEIKNRVNGLFGSIRDYEAIQLQSYINMCNASKGYLLELHKLPNGGMDYDIKPMDLDPAFLTEFVPKWFGKVRNFVTDILPIRDDIKLAIMTGDCSVSSVYYS